MITAYMLPGSRTWKAAEEAIPGDLWPKIQKVWAYKDTRPKRTDLEDATVLVMVAGVGSASKAVEFFASNLRGYPIYVPECSDWLGHRVRKALDEDTDLALVDAALATTDQLSGAK